MVSFVCDYCQETLKKNKLDQHTYRCKQAQFTCIDCNTTFANGQYRTHTQCISEEQKYQGKLYKPKGGNPPNLIQQIKQKQGDSQSVKAVESSVPVVQESKESSTTSLKRKRQDTLEWSNEQWTWSHKREAVYAAACCILKQEACSWSELSKRVVELITKHPQNPFKKSSKIEKILNEKMVLTCQDSSIILK